MNDRIPLDDWVERSRGDAVSDWRLYSGYRVRGKARLARTVQLVELARQAEMEGHVQRADFFWREAHRTLSTSGREGEEWMTVTREVFWDTHWAFVRGALRARPAEEFTPDDRAFVHAEWLQSLAELLPKAACAERASLEAVLTVKLDALERAGRAEEALRTAQALARLAPDVPEYVSRTASAHLRVASQGLSRSGDSPETEKAILRVGVNELAKLRQGGRPNLAVLEGEAMLRQALAFRLAATSDLSRALVESRMALALNPFLENGEENFKKLAEAMTERQGQMESVRAELRGGGKELSAEGHRLMDDAAQGFGPMERFLNSEEPEQLTELHTRAMALSVWDSLGLVDPGPDSPGPRELLVALGEILRNPPREHSMLSQAWQKAVTGRASLTGVDGTAAVAYLARRLFPETADGPPPKRALRLSNGPAIEPAPRRLEGDGEPFRAWLYGRTDLRVKVQCAVAAGLLLVTVPLGVQEYLNRGIRAAAYAEAQAAATAGDPLRVMDASGRFLRHGGLASDARQAEVARLYDEALVTWLVKANPEEHELQRRIDARRPGLGKGRTD